MFCKRLARRDKLNKDLSLYFLKKQKNKKNPHILKLKRSIWEINNCVDKPTNGLSTEAHEHEQKLIKMLNTLEGKY